MSNSNTDTGDTTIMATTSATVQEYNTNNGNGDGDLPLEPRESLVGTRSWCCLSRPLSRPLTLWLICNITIDNHSS